MNKSAERSEDAATVAESAPVASEEQGEAAPEAPEAAGAASATEVAVETEAPAAAASTPAEPRTELPERDSELLRQSGFDLEPRLPQDDPVARTAAEFMNLIDTGLTVAETAERLGVHPSRVRQRLGERTLYGIRIGTRWQLPAFQFVARRQIPGLAQVLPRLDPELSPVAVTRWFTSPCPDLAAHEFDRDLSPREWLLTGHPVEPVVRLAAGI